MSANYVTYVQQTYRHLFTSLFFQKNNFLCTRIFKNACSSCVVNRSDKIDPGIQSSSSEGVFCNASLNFIRPTARKIFSFIAALVVNKIN